MWVVYCLDYSHCVSYQLPLFQLNPVEMLFRREFGPFDQKVSPVTLYFIVSFHLPVQRLLQRQKHTILYSNRTMASKLNGVHC